MELAVIELLREAYQRNVTVRVSGGRLVCAGPGDADLGARLRDARSSIIHAVGNWDRYTGTRLTDTFLTIAAHCPKDWKAGDADEREAEARLTVASNVGDAAAFEAALYQYELACYRAFRRWQRDGSPVG